MKYTYTLEMTPEELGAVLREVGTNMPTFLEGVLRSMPDALARVQSQASAVEASRREGAVKPGAKASGDHDNVLTLVFDSGDSAPSGKHDDELPRDPQQLLRWFSLTHEQGLMRTLEVIAASDTSVSVGERGLADRPASYEGDGVVITANWPQRSECEDLDNEWYDFLTEWCHGFSFPSDDPKEAERRPKMLQALIGTPGEVNLKKHILFNAQACMNRAVYNALTEGLACDGAQHMRFKDDELLHLKKLADHISANIMLVAHGTMPELRVLHDITGKWTSFLTPTE